MFSASLQPDQEITVMTVGIGDRTTTGESRWSVSWGDSEMARRVLAFDWSATPLGHIGHWPRSLMSAVAICLQSRFQMAIYWGPELNCIYNDAELLVLGELHPRALGMPARELLRDSWNVVGPQLQAVMERGHATWAEDQPLTFDRRGAPEVGYFTYSYSPIPGDRGGIGGVLLVTQDTTARVLAERRLDVLRDLATRSIDASAAHEACKLAAQSMRGRAELEFILIYLAEEDGHRATCVATSGRSGDPAPARPMVELEGRGPIAAVFRELAESRPHGGAVDVDADLFVVGHADGVLAPRRAVAVPITRGSAESAAGFLVAGISSNFAADDSYRHFIEMLGLGVGRIVAAARAREFERARTRSIAALEQAKTALFGNASHELRTPLSLVLGPLDQVLDQADLPAATREQLELAQRSASRMLKLVNGLLDFSRIEAGERIGAFQPTDVAQLTRDVVAMFTSTADLAGVRLSLDCPPLADCVNVDREAWEQIVSNLVSNALKFTLAGSILVRIRRERQHVVLTVHDTGIGIAAEDLDRIFSRFYRVGDPRARTYEGTGIGLALVRELVHMHAGSVEAQSSPGHGTRMIVRIPVGRAHLPGEMLSEDSSRLMLGASAALFVEEARGWLSQGPLPRAGDPGAVLGVEAQPSTAPAVRDRDRVLVVEDNYDMRAYLHRLLTPHYAVDFAVNGLDALEIAIDDRPSVVISDVMMPGMDGLGLLRKLRQDARTRDLPVILVSARADSQSTLDALELGADDYIVKPFSARELLARVRATLEAALVRSDHAEARGRAKERALTGGELRALLNDLRAAQRRVAAAGDAERRRIERNLHDGAQQRLMAIRLELGLFSERFGQDQTAAKTELDRLRLELDEALEELRELAHGLYPPLLASDGLCAALAAAARRAPIPVEMDHADFTRLPRAIESAAYFCCLEALQNAAKHAGNGARARVHLELRDGALHFRVADDGVGFDRDAVSAGDGLMNLSDRLEALGGGAEITSIPGRGTTVAGQIPLP